METGNTETTSETSSASESSPETTSSGSGYSVTDPGYQVEAFDSGENELEALIAENTKPKPSETSDDANSETTVEETVETPTESEAVDSEEISDELYDRALDLGYTVDEMKAFSDAKSLEKELSRVERIQARFKERQGVKAPEQEVPPEDPAVKEPDWDALVEQGHDPDSVALQKQTWQRAEKAEALARQLMRTEQNRAWEAQCERFDNTLDNIGDEFKPILGTGRQAELAKASPEQAINRQKVFDKMNMLRHGYLTAGQKLPSEADLISEAVHATFYKHSQTTARTKLKNDIKKAGSQALSRPSSSGQKPLSGPALAEHKENEFWKSRSV